MKVSHLMPLISVDAKVHLCLSASQAKTLWFLLEGVRNRHEFSDGVMHRLLCIQHRLQVAMNRTKTTQE